MAGRIRYMSKEELDALSVQRTVSAFADMVIASYQELDAAQVQRLQKRADYLHNRIIMLDPSKDRENPIPDPTGQIPMFPELPKYGIVTCSECGCMHFSDQPCNHCHG